MLSIGSVCALIGALTAAPLMAGCSSAASTPPLGSRALSWVSPDAKNARTLLFVSDLVSGDLYILTVPDLTLEGTLTGFQSVVGLCSDKQGNVWVTDGAAPYIYDYSRTGVLLATLSVPGGSDACAIDPINGDLAVSNAGLDNAPGAVYIFKHASGTPTTVTNPDVESYDYPAYDAHHNLFFNGLEPISSSNYDLVVSEAPAGSTIAHTINIAGAPSKFASGMVQWDPDDNRLLVGDVFCHNAYATCIYEIAISGSSGKITGSTALKNVEGGPACAVYQAVLLPNTKTVAGGDSEAGCSSAPSSVSLWPLGHGGKPSHSDDKIASLSVPLGATLSVRERPR